MEDYINLFEQSIDEAYIGKTDKLLEIEKQFDIIRNNVKSGQDINSRPEVQKLNRLVEEQFGMEIFSLRINNFNDINACTKVIGTKFDIVLESKIKNLVVGSQESGYRFKTNNHLCVIVDFNLGLIKSPNVTSEGLTAVLLHEIGHNFANCLDKKIRLYDNKLTRTYYNYLIWKASLLFSRKYKKELKINTNKYETKESQKQQKSSKIRGWLKGLSGLKYNFKSFCSEVINRLLMKNCPTDTFVLTGKDKEKQIKKNNKDVDRRNEVFADKFAAVYGYGVALPKALYNMEVSASQNKATRFIDKVFGNEINDHVEKVLQNYYLFDPHPHVIQRTNSTIKALKAELEKEDLDPKVKNMLKNQINQIEQFVKEITTATKDDSEREATRKAFYKTINEESPDSLTEELEKEIEKELDEGLKKNS